MADQQEAQLTKLLEAIMPKERDNTSNLVDTRGVGKPPVFKGIQDKYPEWMAKLLAYLRVLQPASDSWIVWAVKQETAIGDTEISGKWGEDTTKLREFSNKLFSNLITNTEDEGFKIVQSAGTGNGLEALRLLGIRFSSLAL